MKKTFLLLLITVISIYTAQAQNRTEDKFGKGINVLAKDSSFSMRFGIRFQQLFIAETPLVDNLGMDDISSKFLIRRSRLKFDGFAFSPKLKYKIELGLTNRDISGAGPSTSGAPRIILDAVLKWNFHGNFTLWMGQTKLPGNRERVISSSKLQFVDRSLVNARFNIDRDAGVQLRHHFSVGNFLVREIASVSMGEGRDITADNVGGYDYTGRVEFLPMGKFSSKGDYFGSDLKREEKPKLSIGITYDYNDDATRQRGQLGSYIVSETESPLRDLESYMADLMFKYKGISIMSEFIDKDTKNPIVYADSAQTQVAGVFYTGSGISAQLGYLFKNNFEIAGRYTQITPRKETGNSDITQYTFGVSRYIVGHALKVQSDVSYTETEGNNDPDLMFRVQIELHL